MAIRSFIFRRENTKRFRSHVTFFTSQWKNELYLFRVVHPKKKERKTQNNTVITENERKKNIVFIKRIFFYVFSIYLQWETYYYLLTNFIHNKRTACATTGNTNLTVERTKWNKRSQKTLKKPKKKKKRKGKAKKRCVCRKAIIIRLTQNMRPVVAAIKFCIYMKLFCHIRCISDSEIDGTVRCLCSFFSLSLPRQIVEYYVSFVCYWLWWLAAFRNVSEKKHIRNRNNWVLLNWCPKLNSDLPIFVFHSYHVIVNVVDPLTK